MCVCSFLAFKTNSTNANIRNEQNEDLLHHRCRTASRATVSRDVVRGNQPIKDSFTSEISLTERQGVCEGGKKAAPVFSSKEVKGSLSVTAGRPRWYTECTRALQTGSSAVVRQ